jgi:hypothetical protein
MADVTTFVDTLGKDVCATVAPKIDGLTKEIHGFVLGVITDLFQRYQPELAGELRTHIVQGGLHVTGQGVRLDLKNRQTGTVVSSLDLPVDITIKVDPVGVTLQNATVSLDVIK